MVQGLEPVLAYHQTTKHHYGRYARGPGYLDWATQPDPFRRYHGARLVPLERIAPGELPPYDLASSAGSVPPAPVDRHSVSQLFFDSLALSAWKQAGGVRWALRVNPSSGNLHPTEGYLVCGPVPGLAERPMVAHYAPREHALEVRAQFPLAMWQALGSGLEASTVLVGLSSIHWREAWKYGERAFRYCQHDVGHALATVSLAAAGLGWQATLLDGLGTERLAQILGISDSYQAEAEHPDCMMAVGPQRQARSREEQPEDLGSRFASLVWQGEPNQLSPGHVAWPAIDLVATATEKPPTPGWFYEPYDGPPPLQGPASSRPSLRRVIHQRRSAVAMDPTATLGRDAFFKLLDSTVPRARQVPFNTLPWPPQAHLVLFVHRVEGLAPGLYLLVRDPQQELALRSVLHADFKWERPPSCPEGLLLYQLVAGDMRATAQQLSCFQEIAADGCFGVGMIVRFEAPLRRYGPWFYRRLFWECGMIGQVLYLEAEAAGVRGTGIGCFFDDAVHHRLGLRGLEFQSLYHFAVGLPVEDRRLTTLPAYP